MSRRPSLPPSPYLVLGAGVAGRAAARRLAALSEPGQVTIFDDFLDPTAEAARELAADGTEVRGGDPDRALARALPGALVKSPGVEMAHPLVAGAEAARIPVLDELEVGWRLARGRMVGVTGTNGKSTVVMLLERALRAGGVDAVSAGNVDSGPPLSAVEGRDGGWIVCEASSYQLEGSPCLLPDIAVLTNLTHDHLGRHVTMARYSDAKRRLFVRGDEAVGIAVVNVDDRFGRDLAGEVRARGGEVRGYGCAPGSDYRLGTASWDLEHLDVEIDSPLGVARMRTCLPGRHNAANLAAALAAADALGVERAASIRAFEAAPRLPGRLEEVGVGAGVRGFVDFAHTPDAVTQVLGTVRAALPRGSRLLVAVSSSGPPADDRAKRPKIGRVAARLADEVVVTTSNPRGESRTSIVADLFRGARSVDGARLHVEPDRGAAIDLIVSLAQEGDVVVLTGRGPLTTLQLERGGEATRLDDREVLGAALRRRREPARASA